MPCMLKYMAGCYFNYSVMLCLNYYCYFIDDTYFLSDNNTDSLS